MYFEKDELEIIKSYKDNKHIAINQLLTDDIETDIVLLSQENHIEYSKESVVENINLIKNLYQIMIKKFLNTKQSNWTYFRNTNISEIEKLKLTPYINKFLSAMSHKETTKNQFSSNWSRAITIQINGDENTPYLPLNEDEILIAPFTKVTNMEEIPNTFEDTNSSLKLYDITIENQELDRLPKKEKDDLYNDIIEKADTVAVKLQACIELDNENAIHYENIRKLEQLLAKHNFTMEQDDYEKDTTPAERQIDLDDIARINLELNSLKNTVTNVFNTRKENIEFVIDWKKDVAVYLMSECEEIKLNLMEQKNKLEEDKTDETANAFTESIEPALKESKNELTNLVRAECQENVAMVNTLLNNIKNLITKQQNHARIAEEMDSNYKALNNAFEMKNFAEDLDLLVKSILNKVDILSPDNKEELDKISKTSIQISTLLNYLNNPKSAVGKKITRFDEINIIEENELKKEIAETIKNIRCEAELKKLRDDIEIIEDKSDIRKFFGRITGRNKIDQTMLEQIQIRQTAIRKTFKTKMPLAYNYSIHELIAEIQMFIKENEDDELVLEDISVLKKIEAVLKKNFVIIDSKVVSIIDEKTGKNLPLASGKISKKELIEIDTYRFLNRYGYDKSNDIGKEPEYQDTVANEIKRIIDYIKSSGVL